MSRWAGLLYTAAKVNLLVLLVSVVLSWPSRSDRVPVSVGCSGRGLRSPRVVRPLSLPVGPSRALGRSARQWVCSNDISEGLLSPERLPHPGKSRMRSIQRVCDGNSATRVALSVLGVTFSTWSCHTFPLWQGAKLVMCLVARRREEMSSIRFLAVPLLSQA